MASKQFEFRQYAENLLKAEQSQVKVDEGSLIRIALVYPNRYDVGISNLGFQEAYRLFNDAEDISCERMFVYDPPYEHTTRSLETQRDLRDFDIIAFSISFELDYPRLVQILNAAKIPPIASDRNQTDPLVIAGGVTTFLNPTPLAPIIDVFLIGEAEAIIPEFCRVIEKHIETGLHRADCLRELNDLKWCYLPQVTSPEKTVQRRSVSDLDAHPTCSSIITPHSHFQNMFCIEVGRGCGRGCRYCAAGHVYRPIRFRSPEILLSTIRNNPFQTKKVGLIGAALSDYPELDTVCESLVNEGYELGLSSFRIDIITPRFLSYLEKANIRSITLAPETGSQRLRKLIKKNLSDEQIFETIELLAASNISTIKLYFMIGLPSETAQDVESIVKLVKKIAQIFGSRLEGFEINVSVNAFIPKPFTPFQWHPMETETNLRKKRRYLTSQLHKIKGVSISSKSTRSEVLQGIFSSGGPEIGRAIVKKLSSKFNWKKILRESKIDITEIIYRKKTFDDRLPWDFIAGGVKKESLWREWQQEDL